MFLAGREEWKVWRGLNGHEGESRIQTKADLEPRLTRNSYNAKVLAEVLNAKPREIQALLQGNSHLIRVEELQRKMGAVGISL